MLTLPGGAPVPSKSRLWRYRALGVRGAEQRGDQGAGGVPIVCPVAVAAGDETGAGVEHLVLGVARGEFRADRVLCELEEFDAVAGGGDR